MLPHLITNAVARECVKDDNTSTQAHAKTP